MDWLKRVCEGRARSCARQHLAFLMTISAGAVAIHVYTIILYITQADAKTYAFGVFPKI
jgi:hypothetical protein